MTDSLTSNRQLTLLLRLLLDEHGALVYGEVLYLSGRSLGRFRAWEELDRLIGGRPPDPDEQSA